MYCSEISPYQKLNTNLIKKLVGGDQKIVARQLYSKNEEFTIKSKFIIVCNNIPDLSDNSDFAFFDRFVNITFPNKFFRNEIQ